MRKSHNIIVKTKPKVSNTNNNLVQMLQMMKYFFLYKTNTKV